MPRRGIAALNVLLCVVGILLAIVLMLLPAEGLVDSVWSLMAGVLLGISAMHFVYNATLFFVSWTARVDDQVVILRRLWRRMVLEQRNVVAVQPNRLLGSRGGYFAMSFDTGGRRKHVVYGVPSDGSDPADWCRQFMLVSDVEMDQRLPGLPPET